MRKLYACGMYRSGSTFIYNLLRLIIKKYNLEEYGIGRKKHESWLEDVTAEDFSIYSYRDVRNVCASWIKFNKNNFKIKDNGKGYSQQMFNGEWQIFTINNFIGYLIEYDEKITKHAKKNNLNVLNLCYEKDIFIDNKIAIVKILEFLNIEYTDKDVEWFYNKLNVNVIKERCESIFKGTHEFETKLWYKHINDGISDHKTYFTNGELDNLDNLTKYYLRDYNLKYGY